MTFNSILFSYRASMIVATPPCCLWNSYKAVFFRSASLAKYLMLPAVDLNTEASRVHDDAHTALADCLSAIVVTACGHVRSGGRKRSQ